MPPYPYEGDEDEDHVNREGVNGTPRRKIQNELVKLSTLALAEVGQQLNSESAGDRWRAAKFVLDTLSGIYKAKDLKAIANKQVKTKEKDMARKERESSSTKSKKKTLKMAPVVDFKKNSNP